MVIVEETTTINLLNQQSLTTIYKHLCLYPEISVEFTPLQENFPLQLTKTTTVKPQPINMQSFEAYCQWIHLQTLPYLRLREHFKVGGGCKQFVGAWEWENLMRMSLLVTSEVTHINSLQHDHPNMSWTKMMPTNRKNPRVSCLHNGLYTTK